MLCPSEVLSFEQLTYPRYISIKYNGIFCLVYRGRLYSRKLKLIPNKHLQARLAPLLDLSLTSKSVFTGELVDPSASFSQIQSQVRGITHSLTRNMGIKVFDYLPLDVYDRASGGSVYEVRLRNMQKLLEHVPYASAVRQILVNTPEEANLEYETAVASGHEGIITRSPTAYYKYGRCTASELNLSRHKEVLTTEATIVEVNQAKALKEDIPRDRLLNGLLDAVHRAEMYYPVDKVGSFKVRDADGNVFSIGMGPGINDATKRSMWRDRDKLIGRTVEFSYRPACMKDKIPVQGKFLHLRDEL